MPSSAAKRIVLAHPAVLTGLLVIAPLLQIATLGLDFPIWVRGVMLAFQIGIMCVWAWAVLVVSNDNREVETHWATSAIFAAPPSLAFIAGVAEWSTSNSPAAFAIFGFLFAGLAMAARALERSDEVAGRRSVGRTLRTVVLMYFSFVGVWVLRARLMRVTDGSPAPV